MTDLIYYTTNHVEEPLSLDACVSFAVRSNNFNHLQYLVEKCNARLTSLRCWNKSDFWRIMDSTSPELIDYVLQHAYSDDAADRAERTHDANALFTRMYDSHARGILAVISYVDLTTLQSKDFSHLLSKSKLKSQNLKLLQSLLHLGYKLDSKLTAGNDFSPYVLPLLYRYGYITDINIVIERIIRKFSDYMLFDVPEGLFDTWTTEDIRYNDDELLRRACVLNTIDSCVLVQALTDNGANVHANDNACFKPPLYSYLTNDGHVYYFDILLVLLRHAEPAQLNPLLVSIDRPPFKNCDYDHDRMVRLLKIFMIFNLDIRPLLSWLVHATPSFRRQVEVYLQFLAYPGCSLQTLCRRAILNTPTVMPDDVAAYNTRVPSRLRVVLECEPELSQ